MNKHYITVFIAVISVTVGVISSILNSSAEEVEILEPVNEPPIVIEEVEEVVEKDPIFLGEFLITAYCSCEKCCGKWAKNRPDGIVYGASGKELIPNYSIAVDPKVIPYGTIVSINGKEYIAADCGGAIKGNSIDIYAATHKEAIAIGKHYADVYLEEGD